MRLRYEEVRELRLGGEQSVTMCTRDVRVRLGQRTILIADH